MLLRVTLGLLCLVVATLAQNNDTLGPADSLTDRYNGRQAIDERKRHFYCLEVGSTIDDFPQVDGEPSSNQNDPPPEPLLWAIFLQYPVLSYLDSQRKAALFDAIFRIAMIGDTSNELGNLELQNFCIANVTHYSVANYEESVLVNIYFQGDDGDEVVDVADFDRIFLNGFNMAGDDLVRTFEGRDAIVVVVPDPVNGITETELNQHPGLLEAAADDDPTRRAVFLGSYPRPTTIEEALRNRRSFAFNPDPTNFGLEAGDIVFAVFGSIFLTAVGVMTVLGFCIHPFFLA